MTDAEDDHFGTRDMIGFGLGLIPGVRSLNDRLAPGEQLNRERTQREMPTPLPASRRRRLLEQEAARHEEKAAKARERAEQLGDIPDRDPFPDETVLFLERGGYNFAVLKASGYWYTTGPRLGLDKANWGQFVDWLVDGGVELAYPMVRGEPATLGNLAPQPPADVSFRRMPCKDSFVGLHNPHAWKPGPDPDEDPIFWCDGQATTQPT